MWDGEGGSAVNERSEATQEQRPRDASPAGEPVPPDVTAAIADLVAEHAHCLDHGEAARLWELYVEDGELLVPPELGLGGSVHGRAALQAWSKARAANGGLVTLHVCSNLRVWALDDGRVGARCAAVVYRCSSPDDPEAMAAAVVPALVSEYEDVCERSADGRWRFVSRRAIPKFIGPELRERARRDASKRGHLRAAPTTAVEGATP